MPVRSLKTLSMEVLTDKKLYFRHYSQDQHQITHIHSSPIDSKELHPPFINMEYPPPIGVAYHADPQ